MSRLPAEYRQEAQEVSPDRKLEVTCGELFRGNTPRLPLWMLEELLPDLVRIPEGADREQRVPLPAGWLARYFELNPNSEVEWSDLTQSPDRKGVLSALTGYKDTPSPFRNSYRPAPSANSSPPTSEFGLKAGIAEEERPKQTVLIPAPEPEVVAEPESPEISAEIKEVEKKPRFFASLPIFQRHEPSKSEEIAVLGTPEESNVELPAATETALTLERLWKLDPSDQLADPVALQSLFMTEEKLTLERVLALAGTLPGLRACVLAHGDQVVCASTSPTGIDLQTLSAQATAMPSQIQESSARMGLGAVPAITLHAEQGVLSFLYQGELCLLVLHADRGFVPGVRERLQEMLGHLSTAQRAIEG